jgi:hypothetical protein
MATGFRYPPTLEFPNGNVVMFKNHKGEKRPRYVLHADTTLKLPRGNTVAMKDEIIRVSRSFGIRADNLCVDRTGNGQGVYDLLRFEWGEVIGVNYSESASDTRIMVEDHDNAKELYSRANSELWFAIRKFIEFGYLKLANGMDTGDLFTQLCGRRFRQQGKRAHVESKPDYKSRNAGKSPDEADGLCLLVHCVRKSFGFIPGMSPENSVENPAMEREEEDDKPRISVDNRFEDLDFEERS